MEPEAQGAVENLNLAERATAAQRAYEESVTAGLETATRYYQQAQQAYFQELQSLYAELTERSQQVYRAYGESLNAAYVAAPSYEACMSEYRQYLERMQELFAGGDPARVKAAYDKYKAQVASEPVAAAHAAEGLQRELEETWSQRPLRQALESTQSRYVESLQRLTNEARDRQIEAWRALLNQLSEIWAQPEISSRTQVALTRLIGSTREVLLQCHRAIEQGSAKAVETLSRAP